MAYYLDGNGNPIFVEDRYFPLKTPDIVLGTPAPIDTGVGTATDNNTLISLDELANLHNVLLAQKGLIQTGSTDIANTVTAVRRPWLEEPEGSDPYDFGGAVALPAVGGTSTVVTFTVPDGYDGVINALSWNFTGGGFVQNSGDIVVRVLRNNAAVRNYDNITVEKGTVQQARSISPLRVYSKQVISMTVTHVANGLLVGSVVGSFVGYFYPATS